MSVARLRIAGSGIRQEFRLGLVRGDLANPKVLATSATLILIAFGLKRPYTTGLGRNYTCTSKLQQRPRTEQFSRILPAEMLRSPKRSSLVRLLSLGDAALLSYLLAE